MPSVLVVDDEPNILEVLDIVLSEAGFEVRKATSARDALILLRKGPVDVVITDIQMPDMSGVDLLKQAKSAAPETNFIMITAFSTTETAIEALQHGAFDYLTKPFKMEDLRAVVQRAIQEKNEKHAATTEESGLEAEQSRKLFQALNSNRIIGRSARMLEVFRAIGTISATESTVLITGESGTGKELVAKAIHEASHRKKGPFVSINCGAFPETLLESELFGYMKGAFTGAGVNKKGLFEVAAGGSVFLDEVGEMTPAMQVKLLRVLQERRLRPLGGTTEVPVDVRVIAATNRDLQAAIRQGLFREDLYYRIAVITIHVPPLRERIDDISLLSSHFLRQYSERSGKKLSQISPDAIQYLEDYSWPGNVRELENTIERAVALETTDAIQPERLPEAVRMIPARKEQPGILVPEGTYNLEQVLAELEREMICKALEAAGGNQTLAAQNLMLTKPSLRHRIQTLGIDPSAFRRS